MSRRVWVVQGVYTSNNGNVYVEAREEGRHDATTDIPIADFPPEAMAQLRRGLRFTHALRDGAYVANVAGSSPLYEALHVVLDYCESEGLDAQLLGDAVALAAVAQRHEGVVQSMLEAGGWAEPEGAHPQRMSEHTDRTQSRVAALAARMFERISEGRRQKLVVETVTRERTSVGQRVRFVRSNGDGAMTYEVDGPITPRNAPHGQWDMVTGDGDEP